MNDNDETSHKDPTEYTLDSHPGQQVILSVLLCVVTIVGVVGNILVVVAVLRFRKLWTPTNKFIASLSVANLLTCITLPYHMATILSQNHGEPENKVWCVAFAAIAINCQVVSLFTLALIAVCRAVLVSGNTKLYERIYKNVNVGIMIAVSWLLPILVIAVSSSARFAKLGYNSQYKACLVVSGQSGVSSFLAGIIVGVPSFFAVVLSYGYIFLHLRRYHKQLKRKLPGANEKGSTPDLSPNRPEKSSETELGIEEDQEGNSKEHPSLNSSDVSASTMTATSGVSPDNSNKPNKREKSAVERTISRRQNEVTRNLFVVVCVFTLCVMPFCVAIILHDAHSVIPWFALLFLSNNAVNPVLHGVLHRPLKDALLQLYNEVKTKVVDRFGG